MPPPPEINVTHEKNFSYVNLSGGKKIPVISSADANFLYGEGRIQKFLRVSNDAAEIDFVREKLNPADGDVIALNLEEG